MPVTSSQIRVLRKRLKLDRQDFATALGVRDTTVWRWETGRTMPMKIFVRKMAEMAKAAR